MVKHDREKREKKLIFITKRIQHKKTDKKVQLLYCSAKQIRKIKTRVVNPATRVKVNKGLERLRKRLNKTTNNSKKPQTDTDTQIAREERARNKISAVIESMVIGWEC